MNLHVNRYFTRATAGTEALSWLELESLLRVERIAQSPRTLEFFTPDTPAILLQLRSVDDVYVHVGNLYGLDHTNPSLGILSSQAGRLTLDAGLAVCRQVRPIPPTPSYAITASLETPCNYSRYEAAAALHQGLINLVKWRYIDHRDNKEVADLDIRLLINGSRATVGLRLGQHPLHRRTYKQASVPGSLKPPVAFCMLTLLNLKPDEILLDPLCGAGTILLEAESDWAPRLVIGSDKDLMVIQQGQANAAQARSEARYILADAAAMPFTARAIDKVCSNLPWGHQVALDQPDLFHGQLINELDRVLRPMGRAVLLTDQVSSLLKALPSAPHLHLVLNQQISLYGSHPTILTLLKQPRPPDLNHPFNQFREEDIRLAPVVRAALLSSLRHPEAGLRLQAARTCRRSRDPDLLQALAQLVDDPVPAIRELANINTD